VTVVPRTVTAVRVLKVRPDRQVDLPDDVVSEEPMQVLVAAPGQAGQPLAVTMRTPGHDFELAAGFAVTEGIAAPAEIVSVDYCEAVGDASARYNHVTVHLSRKWQPPRQERWFAASSSCGICGKASIEEVERSCAVVPAGHPVPASLIPSLPDRLRQAQRTFEKTGGLHAAGLFGSDGELLCGREDVGRHNAVDKVVGWTVLSGMPAADGVILAVSGRVSFEIVQKAAMAGFGVIAAVSAPSSLAVDAADRFGVTVAAFVRGGSYNVYTHPERLDYEA
jgi:FdhD protein